MDSITARTDTIPHTWFTDSTEIQSLTFISLTTAHIQLAHVRIASTHTHTHTHSHTHTHNAGRDTVEETHNIK